jgi:hypothetical protein
MILGLTPSAVAFLFGTAVFAATGALYLLLRAGAIMWGWAFPDWLTYRQSR